MYWSVSRLFKQTFLWNHPLNHFQPILHDAAQGACLKDGCYQVISLLRYFSPYHETPTWAVPEDPLWSGHSLPLLPVLPVLPATTNCMMMFYVLMNLHRPLPPLRGPSSRTPYSFQTSFPQGNSNCSSLKTHPSSLYIPKALSVLYGNSLNVRVPTRLSTPPVQADVNKVSNITSPGPSHSTWHKADTGQTGVTATLEDGSKEQ